MFYIKLAFLQPRLLFLPVSFFLHIEKITIWHMKNVNLRTCFFASVAKMIFHIRLISCHVAFFIKYFNRRSNLKLDSCMILFAEIPINQRRLNQKFLSHTYFPWLILKLHNILFDKKSLQRPVFLTFLKCKIEEKISCTTYPFPKTSEEIGYWVSKFLLIINFYYFLRYLIKWESYQTVFALFAQDFP